MIDLTAGKFEIAQQMTAQIKTKCFNKTLISTIWIKYTKKLKD